MKAGATRARLGPALAFLAASLWPALASACPYCAGRSDGGIGRVIALGAFVFFPFAVAWAVVQFIKRGETGSLPAAARDGLGRSAPKPPPFGAAS